MLKKLFDLAKKDLYVQAVSVFAILVSLTVVAVAYIKTTDKKTVDNTNTSYDYQTLPEQNNTFSTNTAILPEPESTTLVQSINPQTPAATQQIQLPQQQTQQTNSVYSWSKEEIISKMSAAINKTKSYKNNISVHHNESFVANITECTGGSIGKVVANALVEAVVKPTDTTLNFSNGIATNADGEQTQLLLPKNGPFSLSASGVTNAKAYQEGDKTVLVVTLVQENCSPTDVPQYNSKSIGYLNVASIDLMGMTITKGEIQYLGSSIMVKVNPSGYVTYAKYSIPLHVYGEGQKESLSGHATFDGEQTEIWEIPL